MHIIRVKLYWSRSCLEKRNLYAKVFFGVLPKIVDELGALARELVDIRGCLINVAKKRLVAEELPDRTFSRLNVGDDRFKPGGGRVKSSERLLGVVIHLLVSEEFAGAAPTLSQITRDLFKIVGNTADLCRRDTQVRYCRASFIVKRVVANKFASRSASGTNV